VLLAAAASVAGCFCQFCWLLLVALVSTGAAASLVWSLAGDGGCWSCERGEGRKEKRRGGERERAPERGGSASDGFRRKKWQGGGMAAAGSFSERRKSE